MSTIYVDYRAATDGTGSMANPRNTVSGLTLSAGDMLLFAAGSTVSAEHLSALTFPDSVTVGVYGGTLATVSGGVTRSDFTAHSAGVIKRSYASNIVGNVIGPSGAQLTHVAWATGADATLSAGQFTFDYNGLVLYVGGSLGDYVVSEAEYGLTDQSASSGLQVNDLEFRSISRHGLMVRNKRGMRGENLAFRSIGGLRIVSAGYHLGNGLEIAGGCVDVEIAGVEASDIFDTGVTAQAWTDGAPDWIDDVHFSRVSAVRCGMAAFEVSTHKANQHIGHVGCAGLLASDIGRGFSGDRGGNIVLAAKSASVLPSIQSIRRVSVSGLSASDSKSAAYIRGVSDGVFLEGSMTGITYGPNTDSAVIGSYSINGAAVAGGGCADLYTV